MKSSSENCDGNRKKSDLPPSDSRRLDAIRGCLIGGAVGDALGAPVDFLNRDAILRNYGGDGVTGYVEFGDGTGAVTDDTQMTLFTAEGLLRAIVRLNGRGICDPVAVVKNAYQRWLKTQDGMFFSDQADLDTGWLIREKQLHRRRAPGMTCIHALENIPCDCRARNNSKGCGTVMRMAPVGILLHPEEAYENGCKFSAITHGHPTGITAGGAFAMLIAYLLEEKDLEESLALVEKHLQTQDGTAETLAALQAARTARTVAELGEGWVAEEALAISVHCAWNHQREFEKGVLAAVNITGDSDSTGAITGNILGLINGEEAIPESWRRNLQEYGIVSRMADDLFQRFDGDPRYGDATREWWEKYPGV